MGEEYNLAKKIPIPNDPDLRASLKEAKEDFNAYAKHFFLQTNILLQETQTSQINLFDKLQTRFKAQAAKEVKNRHQSQIKEAKEALLVMIEQIKELQDMEKLAKLEQQTEHQLPQLGDGTLQGAQRIQ